MSLTLPAGVDVNTIPASGVSVQCGFCGDMGTNCQHWAPRDHPAQPQFSGIFSEPNLFIFDTNTGVERTATLDIYEYMKAAPLLTRTFTIFGSWAQRRR